MTVFLAGWYGSTIFIADVRVFDHAYYLLYICYFPLGRKRTGSARSIQNALNIAEG
jgi:hypothetical protein